MAQKKNADGIRLSASPSAFHPRVCYSENGKRLDPASPEARARPEFKASWMVRNSIEFDDLSAIPQFSSPRPSPSQRPGGAQAGADTLVCTAPTCQQSASHRTTSYLNKPLNKVLEFDQELLYHRSGLRAVTTLLQFFALSPSNNPKG